jgi:hypothetical protein
MKTFLWILFCGASFFAADASAVVRVNFTPGNASAVILLQGISAGHPLDPDARTLFDLMAIPPTAAPGGQGKGLKTDAGDFNLSCVAREALPEDAICSFVVKKSDRAIVTREENRAEIVLTGFEAQKFYEGLAGAGSSERFHFVNRSGEILLDSTPNVTRFYFIRR